MNGATPKQPQTSAAASRRRGAASSSSSSSRQRRAPLAPAAGVAVGPAPALRLQIPGLVKVRPLPPAPDLETVARYKDPRLTPGARQLLNFKLSKQKNKEVQLLV